MKRLTQWNEYGNADIIALSDTTPEAYVSLGGGAGFAALSFSQANALTDALNRLATYEDTDLTPSDIKDLRNELCIACGNFKQAHLGACDGCRWRHGEKDTPEKDAAPELLEAIEQLKSLRSHCAEFADPADPESVWHKDIKALDTAIAALAIKTAISIVIKTKGGQENER